MTADENLILPTIKAEHSYIPFKKIKPICLKLEQTGRLIKTQAELLTAYGQTEEEAMRLAASLAFSDLAAECDRFASLCLNRKETAYLQVAREAG